MRMNVGEDVRGKEHLHIVISQLLWKSLWSFLKNITKELTDESIIPVLGLYLRKPVSTLQKYWHSFVMYSIIYNNNIQNMPKCLSVEEWIRKI